MNSANISYHEKLLHWIWENQHFDFQHLQTIDGNKVHIHNPGNLNKTDGPDFSSAEITIGRLRWFGDVELHWHLADWRAHQHHKDAHYNNVILHVVFEDTESHSIRKDKTSIPTLCLNNYLAQPLQSFLKQYQQQQQLPCAGHFSFISEEAFSQQLKRAHKEYFEQKVNDLLAFYDADLPPSQAWLKLLTIGLFDGLGIAHNRTPMQKLAARLVENVSHYHSPNMLRVEALKLSGINDANHEKSLHWSHKGCRPGNHPRIRIQQATEILWHLHKKPIEHWTRNDPKQMWKTLLNCVDTKPGIGKERGSILFGTVFLPALYLLGNLLFNKTLKSRSWALWQQHKAQIPTSLLKLFDNTEISRSLYRQKLGSIYQLRSYCRPRNCQDCNVFKSVISS